MPDDELGQGGSRTRLDCRPERKLDAAVGQAPFERVVAEHGPMIKRIAAIHEVDRTLAEELVQEILFALWRALPSFRGQGSERAFVARIATNRAVSHVKKALRLVEKGGVVSEDVPAPGRTPEAEVLAQDQKVRLFRAVGVLPLALRQPVLLTLEGLSGDEVASVLGISANAVAIRLTRAKEVLRTRLRG